MTMQREDAFAHGLRSLSMGKSGKGSPHCVQALADINSADSTIANSNRQWRQWIVWKFPYNHSSTGRRDLVLRINGFSCKQIVIFWHSEATVKALRRQT